MNAFFEWLNYTSDTAFGMEQGALAGVVFFLGVLLIWLLPKYKWLAAALLLIGITPLALAGFWFSPGDLGISDWDYYFSLHTTHRNTLLEYHALPFWNPYICGGTAGLADPEFRFFTPTFLAQLIFGIPTGFRIAIYLAVATTAVGMLMLSKRVGLSVYAALLAAIGVAFSSVNLLEMVEGHPNIFSVMWISWIFWAWFGAYQLSSKFKVQNSKLQLQIKNYWILVCAGFLALTFFQGGIYLLMYTGIAFLALPLLAKRHADAFKVSLFSGLWALGFAAIKLIPVLLWLQQFQDEAYASSTSTLRHLHEVFFGRHLHGAGAIIPNQGSGWHEYGAYIGIPLFLLALFSLVRIKHRIIFALVLAAILATLLSTSGPWLKPLFDQAPFLPRSNISRVVLFAVIPISLLAGFGLDAIPRFGKGKLRVTSHGLLVTSIVAIIAIDLMSLAYPLSEQAFVLPRVSDPIPPAPSPIAYSAFDYKTRLTLDPKTGEGTDYTRAYELILKGYGTLSYCSVLGPEPSVRTVHDEENNGLIFIETDAPGEKNFEVLSWTPNSARVRVTTPSEAYVILNTNYAEGWLANGIPAIERAGRVSILLPAGMHEVFFEYKTPGFLAGAIISLVTVVSALIMAIGKLRRLHE